MQLLRGLKDLKKAKGGGGFLTNKIIQIQSYSVRVENVLGEGGFATIYRCSDNTTKATFALKHFRLSGHAEAVAGVKAEVEVMKALRSDPNVLNIRAYSFSGPSGAEEEAYVLLDYCKDNLVGYLQARNFKLDSLSVLRVFLPVCRAVQSMHHMDPPRAHRDLKAENVLLHEKDYWVLCDFGSATSAQQVYSNQRDIALEEENIRRHTTPAYRAPEMWDLYSREFIGVQVDVWALGCLLYLLCFGRLPFDGEAKLQILNGQYSMPTSQPEQLRSLIRGMLEPHARQRMRIDEVMSRVEQMAPPDLLRSLPTQASAPPSTVSASPSQGSIDSQYADAAGAPSRHANSPDRQRAKGQPSRLSQQGDGQMWASFESTPLATATGTGAVAAAAPPPSRPQLYPTVGSPPPPASSTQRGQHKVPAGREPSWASFESSGSRPGAAAAAGSSRPCTVTPSQNSTPAAAAEGAGLPGEGPLSAGMAGLLAGSPPAAPRLTPYPGRGAAGSAAHPQPAPQHQFEVRLSGGQPVSMAMPEAACTPGGGSSGRRQQEAPSSTRPFGLQPGSLPSSPMHSRGSSRNVDRISRSSFDSLAGNAVSASPQNKVDHSFAEAEQLQLHTARLEEHCRVLEQLLEERNAEVRALRETNARQYEELQQLKGARQQSQQNGQQTAAKPMPGSDNMQDVDMHSKLHLEVHDGGGAESSWVAFGGSGLLEDAPTPTVIKSKGRPQPPVEPPGTAFATSPATPFGEVLGAKLDLGGAGMPDQDCRSNQQQQGEGPSRAQLGGSQTSGSMLSGRTGSGSSLGGWDRQLPFEEFNPLSGDPDTRKVLRMQDLGKPVGGRAGAVSAQPSPAKGFVGPCVEASGSVLGSPPKSRRGASLLQGSPTKGAHRRHISEPFFNDLNPLG